ncbi:MAG TPA: HAD-IA family hydrolase [Acidimicrobiales bacterium]|nr:HAD-IA family hydrolase [Acidimicrobiales bacterium]
MASPPVEAVLFDFGGVLSTSPFNAFERHERARGLPTGFIRTLNATNAHDNAWARLERNEVDFEQFCSAFEAEARAAGGSVDARELFAGMTGEMRPEMLEAVRRCHERLKTGLLTNNFVTPTTTARHNEVLDLFDVVVQSAIVGVRKPDPRFYLMACTELAIAPSAAVFLDDLGVNLKPARQLGMQTIKVVDPSDALLELESIVGFPLR